MCSGPPSLSLPESAATRISIACVPCRSRHLRCDGQKPNCSRCCAESKLCSYKESRRGGLTRAALAARRNATAAVEEQGTGLQHISQSCLSQSSFSTVTTDPTLLQDDVDMLGTDSSKSRYLQDAPPNKSAGGLGSLSGFDVNRDPFIGLYYKYFHRLHPCVLPRKHLARMLKDPAKESSMKPLITVMKFVGSLFTQSEHSSQLKEAVITALSEREQDILNPDAFMAQFYLLSSISLYWCGDELRAREVMDYAIQVALELGMHRQYFATANGFGDPTLQECWRRTWWQIYIVDAYYAAMKHVTTFATFDVEATTELPCEEDEYESGVCTV